MIRNPIIHKEVISSLRTRKAVLMQAAFFLVAAALLWFYWPAEGLQDLGGGQARQMYTTLAVGELLLVALFAPAFTAASLTGEKEHNTWESLYATALRPWEIALGKMAGALSHLALLVLTGAAAMAAPLLLGGVSGLEVVAAVALLLLTAVYVGMIGLLVSVLARRSYRAVITTYALLLAVVVLFALPAWPVSSGVLARGGPAWQKVLHVLASLSPLQAMLSLVSPGGVYTTGAAGLPAFWKLYIPLSLLVTAGTTALCLWRMRRPVGPPRPREKARVIERGRITARSFLFLVDPRKRKKSIRCWQNPVLVKEFRTRPSLQAHWLLRAVGAALVASILLMFLVALSVSALAGETMDLPGAIAVFVAVMMVLLIVLVGPAMTSGAICSDRETGVWDLLRTTRLSSWRIVSGKFQASILPLLLLVLAMVPALLIVLFFNAQLWPKVARALQVTAMTIAFTASIGAFFSSLLKRTAAAAACTYAVLVVLALVSMLVMLDPDLFSRRVKKAAFLLNPIAAVMDAAGHRTMQGYGLVGPHLLAFGLASAALFALTVIRVIQLRRPD